MKTILLCVLFVLSASFVFAQTEQLPDILKPDAASESIAQQMGAGVFKLLPRGMYRDAEDSYADSDNPIGIRGGGSYYSFSTRSHSYNKQPELNLEQGHFSSGFAGYNFGFLTDIGPRNLLGVDSNSVEASVFLSFKLPQFEQDIRNEIVAIHGKQMGAMTTYRSLPAVVGDTYLIRAINWDRSDIVVAFQLLGIDANGSATIAWKKLAAFEKPFYLYMTDEELREKVSGVIAEEKLSDIEFTVKDNWLFVRGSAPSLNRLNRALKNRGLRYRGQTDQAR